MPGAALAEAHFAHTPANQFLEIVYRSIETAITDGTCPDPQPKSFDFFAPATAITALQSAGVTLTTEANNHGEDCGPAGLQMALTARAQSKYTILGIGQSAAEAFTPYQTTIDGEHIGIIAATQVIDDDLQIGWTATASQPGLASAYDVADLVSTVEAARKIDDTVVVFLHWGVELDACPDPLQEPLANELVQAGADIIVGSHAHVLLGGGYLGSAYVDYGLGNFAVLQHSGADQPERLPGRDRHRAPHRRRHVAPRSHRGQPARAARWRRGGPSSAELDGGTDLY